MRLAKGHLHIQPAPIEDTDGILGIPETAAKEPNWGTVLSSGRGCRCYGGDRVFFLNSALEMLPNGTAIIPERWCYLMFNTLNPSLKNMMLHDGWVLLEIPFLTAVGRDGELVFDSQKSSEAEAMVTCMWGTVVTAARTAVNPNDPIISSYFNKDKIVRVIKGDKVFFSPYVINAVRSGMYLFNSYFERDGKHYIIIPYREIMCKVEGKEMFTPLNGYAVATKVEQEKGEGELWVPEKAAKRTQLKMYSLECDLPYASKGEKIIFEPKIVLNELVPEYLRYAHNLSKPYYFFKEYTIAAVVNEEKIEFV